MLEQEAASIPIISVQGMEAAPPGAVPLPSISFLDCRPRRSVYTRLLFFDPRPLV